MIKIMGSGLKLATKSTTLKNKAYIGTLNQSSIEVFRMDRKSLWRDKEPTYNLLRRFGFEAGYGEIRNLDEMLNRVFSKEEVENIMGYRILGSLRVWLLTKRRFHINYWMYLYLTKTPKGYQWRYGDSLVGT